MRQIFYVKLTSVRDSNISDTGLKLNDGRGKQ